MRLSPAQIVSFLVQRGWVNRLVDNLPDDLAIFENENFPSRQLTVQKNESAPDFQEALELVVSKLAFMESVSTDAIRRELEKASDQIDESADACLIKILDLSEDSESIPLFVARASIVESEMLLMAASCQSEKPAHYYRRIDNKLSNAIARRAVFNHTRKGSFILTVSCGILAKGEQLGFGVDPKEWTATRRTYAALSRGITQLESVILDNRAEEFTKDMLASKEPIVSSNFCESLGNLVMSNYGKGLEFSFLWSPVIKIPSDLGGSRPIHFVPEMADTLYKISTGLLPEEKPQTARFVGTVEALRGDLDHDGERAGWVEFSIVLEDGRGVRASAYLTASQYKRADEAHIAGAQRVAITGTLEPRPRVWSFSEVIRFELARLD